MKLYKKIILVGCFLLIGSFFQSFAQKRKLTLSQITNYRSQTVTKMMPNIIKWVGDDYYVESLIFSRESNLVSVKTGEKSPYAFTSPIPSVKSEKRENWTFSPDSTWAAYTFENDLYAVETATGRRIQYTTDGSEVILNGKSSWVYYEEILGRSTSTFWWSPDSKHLAFFRSDESKVPVFPIFNSQGQHGSLNTTRYPKAGDSNPQIKIGIVGVEGGDVLWADFNTNDDQYFGRSCWADNSSLWVQWMPREQNQLKIYSVDVKSGKKIEVYDEQRPTWVSWKEEIIFLKKQPCYLIQNDTDGWDRIYLYNKDGSLKKELTKGRNFWSTKIMHVDEQRGVLYFTSFGEISTRCDLYSVKLDGSSLKRLTFGDYHHIVQLSPNARYFITRYSNTSTPNCNALVDAHTGKIIRTLFDSKSDEYDSLELSRTETVWYTTRDGLKIPAIIKYPAAMDTTVLHPVSIFTYGGPDAGRVQDRWWGADTWKSYEGVIYVVIDHRGSGHLGKKGLDYLHRNLGKYEIEDFTDFVKEYIYTKSYVDRAKISIEGHSYGGYLTALAVTKAGEYFRMGIADSGVMDWALYDSHYTERYMDTPQSNPEGYKQGSVMTYVDNYDPKINMLYIRHGLLDDNVHPQNSIQLIQQLQVKEKPFEMMFYPNCTHVYLGPSYSTTTNDAVRFWYRYMLQKPAPADVMQ